MLILGLKGLKMIPSIKDVRAKNFYNTDFFHTLAAVR